MRTIIIVSCFVGSLLLGDTLVKRASATEPGQQWHVDDDAPNDPGVGNPFLSDPLEDGSVKHPFDSIQEAIDIALSGDTVTVAPGTYHEGITYQGKSLVVIGAGANVTTIDGGGNGTVVRCINREGIGTALEGFTITGGSAFEGGGMFNIDSYPRISNCVFANNYACYGGAIYDRNSDVLIESCTFDSNTGCHGAGIWNDGASQTVVEACTFRNNIASVWGGGIVSAGERTNMTVHSTVLCGNLPDQIYDDNYVDGGSNSLSLECCPADIDDSGMVAVDDLLLVIALWGNPTAFGGAADINHDSLVNVDDLLLVISSWGPCP